MRPLLLTMRAFGPFLHEQTVDFADLDGSFFLIHGPTGAGKTSLLDAMCYALYGRSTGDRETYRSHHADETIETLVSFTFALGGDVYRSERRLTKGGSTVPKLERRKGDSWELLSSRKERETSRRIEDLLGFNVEQFRRVVMLPQGQFARFLLAKSDEKETILTTLFGTRRYELITERLNRLQQEANGLMQASERGRISLLENFAAASVSELEERLPVLDQERARLSEAITENANRLFAVEAALVEARETSRLLEELQAAEKETRALTAREGIHREERDTLDRSDRAASIEEVLRSRDEAALHLEGQRRLAGETERKRTAAVSLREDQEKEWKKDEERAPERDGLKSKIEQHRTLEPELRAVADLEKSLTLLIQEENKKTAGLQEAEKTTNGLGKEIEEIQKKEALFRESASLLPAARSEKEKVERLLRLVQIQEQESREAEGLEARFEERKVLVESFRTRLEQRRADLRVALDGRNRNLVAHLSASLHSGEPCPVCGSREHPAPAVDPGKQAGPQADEIIEGLQVLVEKEEGDLERLRNDLRDLERDLLSRRDRAAHAATEAQRENFDGISLSHEAIFSRLQEAVHRVDACVEAGEALEDLVRRRSLSEDRRREAEALFAKTKQELDQLRESHIRLESEIAGSRRRIPEGLSDPAALLAALSVSEKRLHEMDERSARLQDAFREALKQEAASQASHAAVLVQLSEAEERFRERSGRFQNSLSEMGFSTEEELQRSWLEKERREALRRSVEEYSRSVELGLARLLKAQSEASGRMPVDLQALEGERRTLVSLREELQTDLGRRSERREKLLRALEQLSELDKDQSEQKSRRELYTRLYEAASGKGGRKIALQRYVLAYRLEEVLGRASERLRRMTHGRYVLRRALASSDMRRSAGLDLEIFDARTGTLRPVASLSGGESFLASLALALSLAEVVQARTGGIRLDTIFIDEGFGSLDSETLDLAIGTLKLLREGGRMVGIISHVEELKNQIEARIEIRPGPAGSTVHLHRSH